MEGLSCFYNLGNTCYINCVLIFLCHLHFLNKIESNNVLYLEWKDIYESFWEDNYIIKPYKYVNITRKLIRDKDIKEFLDYEQGDAIEYLQFFFSELDNEMIYNKFNIEFKYIYIDKDKVLFEKYDKNMIMNIYVPDKKNITLKYCIEEQYNSIDDNIWIDENNNSIDIKIRTLITRFPEYLIIQLSNNNGLLFGEYMRFRELYELFAIINYNRMMSHYYVSVRKDNGWATYNDDNIRIGNFKDIISRDNLCLIYKKNNNIKYE